MSIWLKLQSNYHPNHQIRQVQVQAFIGVADMKPLGKIFTLLKSWQEKIHWTEVFRGKGYFLRIMPGLVSSY